MIIPESDALKIGIRPDQVQVSEKYGGGFVTYVDGLHQLHCLVSVEASECLLTRGSDNNIVKDLLRQSLYYNYDFYKSQGRGSFVDNSTIFKAHVCKQILPSMTFPPQNTTNSFVPSTLCRHHPTTTHVHNRYRPHR